MSEQKLEGIGGWLLFYVIILVLSLVSNILSIISSIFLSSTSLLDIIPGGKSTTILGIITNSISFIFWIIILIPTLKKKTYAPKWNIFTLWLLFAISVISTFISPYFIDYEALPGPNIPYYISAGFGIVLGLIWPIIWTLYFKKSVRVKNTFVNP